MPGTNLTREEARQRAELISVSHYDIALDLMHGPKQFRAATTVTFSATAAGADTFIDLIADSVEKVVLNGEELDPRAVFADSRIALPGLQSENVLYVESTQAYTNTGEGMHRFVDPVDGEIYLYTQFEVPDSRRVYPVFEQPDLKAVFIFTVTAPARWKVVSNQPIASLTPAGQAGEAADKPGEDIATWVFEPTPVMSSYITAIVAGPYHEVRSELTNADGRTIPLGVFCRESLAEHLDHDYIFDVTRAGFDFFAKEFDYPYPFDKYDQLFVPEFNMGAMEHIGAVTHTEAYVFRGTVSDAMRERRDVTILHELAHMWFGNLVTMRWWNDLWLNESFAEYAATLSTAEATQWTDCWTTFAASEKAWAYRQDQLPSTHPIVADIPDLDAILTNFDGITYAKGASVLKTLAAFVGRKAFMQGVHNYFKKHAYRNTELPDLLTELEATSGRDLADWTARWLETSGVNTLTAQFETDSEGRFTSFAIEQSAAPKYPTLRPHRIAIGFYNLVDGSLERSKRLEVDIAAQPLTEISEIVGLEQPDLLLLNDEDLTYAKIRLDERSRSTVENHLRDLGDSLARAVLWGALWDMTRDGEYPASRFVDVALGHLAAETHSSTLRVLLSQLATAAGVYTAPQNRARVQQELENRMWELTEQAPAGSDQQFQFVTHFAHAAHSSEQLDRVAAILDGELSLPGLTVDQDLRWVLIASLAAGYRVDAEGVDRELAKDSTASGAQSAARARAAIATPEAKQLAWDSVFSAADKPNLIVRYTGLGFCQVADTSLLEPYVEKFFAELLRVWETRSYAIVEELVEGFYPDPLANQALADAAQSWLDANGDAPAPLRRLVVEALAGTERALVAQKADTAAE